MPTKIIPIALVLLVLALPAAAAEMNKRQAGNVIKEAQGAEAKGDLVKARELYQLVATDAAKVPERRADALYHLVLLEAAQPAAARDGDTLDTSAKEFLAQFPKHDGRAVVAAVAGVLADSRSHEGRVAELEAQIAAAQEAHKELTSTGAKDAAKKVEELEGKLRRSNAEVEILKAELAKKDEALKKLKQVVVGGGG